MSVFLALLQISHGRIYLSCLTSIAEGKKLMRSQHSSAVFCSIPTGWAWPTSSKYLHLLWPPQETYFLGWAIQGSGLRWLDGTMGWLDAVSRGITHSDIRQRSHTLPPQFTNSHKIKHRAKHATVNWPCAGLGGALWSGFTVSDYVTYHSNEIH